MFPLHDRSGARCPWALGARLAAFAVDAAATRPPARSAPCRRERIGPWRPLRWIDQSASWRRDFGLVLAVPGAVGLARRRASGRGAGGRAAGVVRARRDGRHPHATGAGRRGARGSRFVCAAAAGRGTRVPRRAAGIAAERPLAPSVPAPSRSPTSARRRPSSAWHVGTQPLGWALAVAIPSLVFGHLRERFGSVWPAVIVHIVYNAGFGADRVVDAALSPCASRRAHCASTEAGLQ